MKMSLELWKTYRLDLYVIIGSAGLRVPYIYKYEDNIVCSNHGNRMFSINCLFLLLFFRMQSTWVNYHWDGRQRSLERALVIVHLMLLVPTYRILWNSHLENIAVFAVCKDDCQSCVVRRNDKQKHRDSQL